MVRRVGVAIIGQSADLAPADRRMYATRDITSTVESIPLIVSSILSKKLAEGLDALVLDVKTGNGAFMRNPLLARELAENLSRVASDAGLSCTALLTDMNQPLAWSAGNSLEVLEVIDFLAGHRHPRLSEVTRHWAASCCNLGIWPAAPLMPGAAWSGRSNRGRQASGSSRWSRPRADRLTSSSNARGTCHPLRSNGRCWQGGTGTWRGWIRACWAIASCTWVAAAGVLKIPLMPAWAFPACAASVTDWRRIHRWQSCTRPMRKAGIGRNRRFCGRSASRTNPWRRYPVSMSE